MVSRGTGSLWEKAKDLVNVITKVVDMDLLV
ncbi:hypothetical protein J5U22_01500 [Saccharolobus shibatae]|uniref:Uncharacterized protein n=1 Tax=Saccharolobus shibatae TaxID=2286 RepID=A0A8F5C0T1_9CREN|nr:hypothetical protein J5U21_01609 [Saccharolobus shibatae]QXJ34953.1 hypothetical protein J5U22_01500 [Saccharolobus shibatae]